MVELNLPVITLVGPTAVGKTAVAVELADRLAGRAEIISADSVQIYRGLDIGSAKPTLDERRRSRFHLLDIADPDQSYTLADFQRDAVRAHEAILGRGNTAILCGGTGLYIRALTQSLGIPHVAPDAEMRSRWNVYVSEHGKPALHKLLAERDPASADRLHPNDSRRVIRALEVLAHTGRSLSDWHAYDKEFGQALLPNTAIFGLNRDRAGLYKTIDARVDRMMEDGFLEEVAGLREAGYARSLHSMRSLGYNEVNSLIDAEITVPECVESIKLHSRQFARRQLIWFRADSRITWLDTEGADAGSVADRIMSLVTEKGERAAEAENPDERIA